MNSALQRGEPDIQKVDTLQQLKIFSQECFAPTYRDDKLGDEKAL